MVGMSPVTSHLAESPREAPGAYSSISLVCTCGRDTARVSESPSVTDYPRRCLSSLRPTFALHPLSESSGSAMAVYLSVSPWQFPLRGTDTGVLVQCSPMEDVEYQSKV